MTIFKQFITVALIIPFVHPGAASANVFEEKYGLKPMAILINDGDMATYISVSEIIGKMEAKGCIHMPPGLVTGYFPGGAGYGDFTGLNIVILESFAGTIPERLDPVRRKILSGFFDERAFQNTGHPPGLDLGPIDPPVREIPADLRRKYDGTTPLMKSPYSAVRERGIDQNSEFLMGNVLINVIVPESGPGGSEDWTNDEIAAMLADINLGLSQYMQATHWVDLDFWVNCPTQLKRVPVSIEPIEGDWNSDPYWINEALDYLSGYQGFVPVPGDYVSSTHLFNNAARSGYPIATDWVFTAYIADASVNECWQGPAGQYAAYTIFLGGPFVVVPYPACRFGTGKDFAHVFMHEMSHVFWALDEYASAGVSCNARSGYLNVRNGNSYATMAGGAPCGEQLSCIMNNYTLELPLPVCPYTMGQVGLGDANENSIPDLYEMPPIVDIIYIPGFSSDTTYDGSYVLSADAINYPVANRNPYQNPETRINYAPILKKGWRQINDGILESINPGDGEWDSSGENLSTFILSGLEPGENWIHMIIENNVGLRADDSIGVTYIGIKFYQVDTEAGSEYIDLSWITASQVFGSDFEIYRRDASADTEFEMIDVVDGDNPHSPGATRNYYVFRDADVVPLHLYDYKILSRINAVIDGVPREFIHETGIYSEKSLIPVPNGLLSSMAPNPFSSGGSGKVSFTVKIPGDFPDVDSPHGASGREPVGVSAADSRVMVIVDIYNVKGQLVKHLFELPLYGGRYKDMEWDGTNDKGEKVSNGIYFIKARAGSEESVKKIVVLR